MGWDGGGDFHFSCDDVFGDATALSSTSAPLPLDFFSLSPGEAAASDDDGGALAVAEPGQKSWELNNIENFVRISSIK